MSSSARAASSVIGSEYRFGSATTTSSVSSARMLPRGWISPIARVVAAMDDHVLARAYVDEQVELLVQVEHVGRRLERRLGVVRVRAPADDLPLLRRLQVRLRAVGGLERKRLERPPDLGQARCARATSAPTTRRSWRRRRSSAASVASAGMGRPRGRPARARARRRDRTVRSRPLRSGSSCGRGQDVA